MKTVNDCRSRFCCHPLGEIFIPFINDKVANEEILQNALLLMPNSGGVADLIKLAMPKIYEFLINKKLLSKMLIQVQNCLGIPQNEIKIMKVFLRL